MASMMSLLPPFVSLLLLLISPRLTSATMCRSCSWSGVEHPTKACANDDVSALDPAASIYVPTVNCGTQNCHITRVLNADGSIHSMARGCSTKAPQLTKCSRDVYFNTCVTVCQGDNCNAGGEKLPAKAPPKAPASRITTKRPKNEAVRLPGSGAGMIVSIAVTLSLLKCL